MNAQRLQLTWYNKDKALIPTETGKYGYTWVDPSDPRYCEIHTLVLDDYVQGAQTPKSDEFEYSEHADLEPQDDNLLILGESGDVLEALTRVPELAEKYVGQVKLIYIDPPFNTAQTFASYEDNLEHSIWLTMMRDRLLHLKKLLSADGSIWVHLDDAEMHRMRLLMDEIFGPQNFVATIVWNRVDNATSRASDTIVPSHDFILVYRKSGAFVPVEALTKEIPSHYNKVDAEGRFYCNRSLRKAGAAARRVDRPSMWFPITAPDGEEVWPIRADGSEGRWQWGAEKAVRDYEKLDWMMTDRGIEPFIRIYYEEGATLPNQTWWPYSEVGSNRVSKIELGQIFPNLDLFATPKPERLLERIIAIGSVPGDIVLDVFAGSGTTAAVAQKMGRRWVTCELLESTFNTFTRPRLEKVINDQDPGGITRTKGERVDATEDGLPDGVSPEDAAKFTSVLNKLIKDDPELKKSVEVKTLKAASKTRRTKEVLNWRGGGGFQVAHLSPACFDYDPALGRVMLTAAATGQTLIESVAANLGFSLLHPDDDIMFDGQRGNSLLKVIEGVATTEEVDRLVEQIQPGETIVLAATVVLDGVREHLRRACKGSRVVAIPDDIFPYAQGGGH